LSCIGTHGITYHHADKRGDPTANLVAHAAGKSGALSRRVRKNS
jgi:hypothetical protein